jgi:hypothetical protein
MQQFETVVGGNNTAVELRNLLAVDGPVALHLHNIGDEEFLLALLRHDDTLARGSEDQYQIDTQDQILENPPDGAEVTFVGCTYGNIGTPHNDLLAALGTDGTTSVAATRQLDSAGAVDFEAAGVRVGDVLRIEDAGTPQDDGTYRITAVNSATQIEVERNWPTGGIGGGTLTFAVYRRCAVMPHSIQIDLTIGAAAITVTDNGHGVLAGVIDPVGPPPTNVAGTIDYFTGLWTFTCDTAPDNLSGVDFTYAEALPVVADGRRTFPIPNCKRENPITLYGAGNGTEVPCNVNITQGV